MHNLFIGTSGYNYKHWKEVFYPIGTPQKDWILYYSKYFNTIEINATFYRNFNKSVYEKWKNKTGDNFNFAIKGPRIITHVKKLNNIENDFNGFFEGIFNLENKLSVVLWQFPANFYYDNKNYQKLEKFINLLPKNTRNAFELRDSSWFSNQLIDLLSKNNQGFVINDSAVFPTAEIITSDFVYIRFHGPNGLYSSKYSDEQLENWSLKIENFLKSYDVYCFFNNDAEGFATKNALSLKNLLREYN